MTPKAGAAREEEHQLDVIRITGFALKDRIKQVERSPAEGEEMLGGHASGKGLASRAHEDPRVSRKAASRFPGGRGRA